MGDDPHTWEDLKARLERLPRGSSYRLAQHLGMNPSQFYRTVNNSRRPLTVPQAQAVAAFLAESGAPAPLAAITSRRELPVFGYAAAGGEETIAFNEGRVVETIKLPMGLELGPGEYFGVRAIGSSMEPRIFPGELLVVRRDYPPATGKDVVVEFSDGSGVVKTYRTQRDGKVFVEQFNPARMLDYDATKVRRLHAVAFKL